LPAEEARKRLLSPPPHTPRDAPPHRGPRAPEARPRKVDPAEIDHALEDAQAPWARRDHGQISCTAPVARIERKRNPGRPCRVAIRSRISLRSMRATDGRLAESIIGPTYSQMTLCL